MLLSLRSQHTEQNQIKYSVAIFQEETNICLMNMATLPLSVKKPDFTKLKIGSLYSYRWGNPN